jgi:hypothetical protein
MRTLLLGSLFGAALTLAAAAYAHHSAAVLITRSAMTVEGGSRGSRSVIRMRASI